MNFDKATQGFNTGSGGNSITFAPEGNDRLLIFGSAVRGGIITSAPTCNVNGTTLPLNLLNTRTFSGNTIGYYWILNPEALGLNLINAGGNGSDIAFVVGSYKNVQQYSQPDNQVDGFGVSTSQTATLTTVADNCWTIMIGYANDQIGTDPAAGAGATKRAGGSTNNYLGLFDSNGPITPAGSTSMTITQTSIDNLYAYMASFAPTVPVSSGINAFDIGD